MRKLILIGMLMLLSVSGVIGVAAQTEILNEDVLANMTYQSVVGTEGSFELVNGLATPVIEGLGDTYNVQLMRDLIAYGEMDGKPAAVAILATTSSGTGNFRDLALIVEEDGVATNVATLFLGDRIEINSIALENNQVEMEVLMQGPTDPMCCPSQTVLVRFDYSAGQFMLAYVKVLTEVISPEEVSIDAAGLGNIQLVSKAGEAYNGNDTTVPTGLPPHLEIQLDGQVIGQIIPIDPYIVLWGLNGDTWVVENLDALANVLAEKAPEPTAQLPLLPVLGVKSDIYAKFAHLTFGNGDGYSVVGHWPVDGEAKLSYQYLGLSDDDAYIVNVMVPLSTDLELPIDPHEAKDLIEATDNAAFSPNLDQLNQMAQSILIAPVDDQSEAANFSEAVVGQTWQWVETQMMDDTLITPPEDATFTLTFVEDGTVSAQADCNIHNGDYEADDAGSFNISFALSTQAFCGENSLEIPFIESLSQGGTWLIQDGDLYLSLPMDSGILKFSPVTP